MACIMASFNEMSYNTILYINNKIILFKIKSILLVKKTLKVYNIKKIFFFDEVGYVVFSSL